VVLIDEKAAKGPAKGKKKAPAKKAAVKKKA
jgi:DNA topoisomerase-1